LDLNLRELKNSVLCERDFDDKNRFIFLFFLSLSPFLHTFFLEIMAIESIPIVDFADFKSNPKKVAQDVFEACKSIGFFYMINHDLPQQDIDQAFALVKKKDKFK
jgi:hypothetical protein